MDNSICKKVTSLLALYIEKKLDIENTLFIENHFKVCDTCYKKYLEMKEVMNNLHLDYVKLLDEFERMESDKIFNIREYESFYTNISPYIDDELSYNESIKFRRYLLKSKPARLELAGAYSLKNNIRHSIEMFKENSNINFSKKIIKKLKNESIDSFDKIYHRAAILLGIMVALLLFVTALMGLSYINESFAQNTDNDLFQTIEMPNNDDELVEFTFDGDNGALLSAK